MSDADVGARVETLRRAKGLSQQTLASYAGVSVNLIKSIETGRRNLTLKTAQAIAPVLGVHNLNQLYGDLVPLGIEAPPAEPHLPAVIDALTAYQITPTGQPSSIDYLTGALDTAWRTWHSSRSQRSDTGAVLPGLLARMQHAAATHTGDTQRQAHALLAETYHLAQAYAAHHAPREILYLAVDRGMTHALASGEPGTIGWALWYAAHLWRSVGRTEYALTLLADARTVVTAAGPDLRLQACLVDLWLGAALTRARAREHAAWADWEQARLAAAALPDGYEYPYTRAGAVRVTEYAVLVATELGDAEEVRRRTRDLAPEDVGSVDHRARHLIELARVNADRPEALVHLLLRAAEVSAQSVAHTPASRDLIRRLLADTPATVRAEVLRLAEMTGVSVA